MIQILDNISKVYVILESIKESKYKYIAITNPKDGEKIMKIKINLEEKDMVNFLDTFFDEGFIVESIDKKEFDSLVTNDILNFKI